MIQRNSVKAMVCIGGMIRKDKSKEGVREEIELAREKNIPVFVVGSVGGCSNSIAKEQKTDWKSLNDYSSDLNEDFMTSGNYHKLALDMIKALDTQN